MEELFNSAYQYVFGAPAKTPAEALRENQRTLSRACREIDRELVLARRDEKRVADEVRTAAKNGDVTHMKQLAKNLIRKRACIQKFYQAKTQLEGVSSKLTTAKSVASMAESMASATRTLTSMSTHINISSFQHIMKEFSKQNNMLDMKNDIMGDTIDDVFEDDEEATDEVVNQVLDELGCSNAAALNSIPSFSNVAMTQPIVRNEAKETDVLLQRLENLKR